MQHRRKNSNHNGTFGFSLGVFVLTLFTVKLAWGWLIPLLFAGAVATGSVSAILPWSVASVTAAVVAATVFFIRHPRRHTHTEPRIVDGSSSA